MTNLIKEIEDLLTLKNIDLEQGWIPCKGDWRWGAIEIVVPHIKRGVQTRCSLIQVNEIDADNVYLGYLSKNGELATWLDNDVDKAIRSGDFYFGEIGMEDSIDLLLKQTLANIQVLVSQGIIGITDLNFNKYGKMLEGRSS